MSTKDKIRDPLPETFATEEEAGEFWDTHSALDYEEYLEPGEDEIAIQRRIFEVPVEGDVFQRLQQEAQLSRGSVPKIIDHILRERFANHTLGLFEKHGIENIGYWTEVVGTSNRLVYMLGYPSLGDKEASWKAFMKDPDWQQARAASEENGPLVAKVYNKILRSHRPVDAAIHR